MCDSRMEVMCTVCSAYMVKLTAKQAKFCVRYLVRRKAKLMVLPRSIPMRVALHWKRKLYMVFFLQHFEITLTLDISTLWLFTGMRRPLTRYVPIYGIVHVLTVVVVCVGTWKTKKNGKVNFINFIFMINGIIRAYGDRKNHYIQYAYFTTVRGVQYLSVGLYGA